MLKRRPGTESVFWGVIAGTVFSVCISLFVHKLALHYYAVVNLAGTFAFVYLLDFLQGKKGGLNAG
jgi:hypothetical protein